MLTILLITTAVHRFEANLFGQIKRDNSPDPAAASSGMGMVPFLGAAVTQPDDRFTKLDFDDLAEEPFKAQLAGGWVAMIQHYFLGAWIPNPDQTHNYSARVTSAGFNIMGFTSPAIVLGPRQIAAKLGRVFTPGQRINTFYEKYRPSSSLSVDYGFLWWIAQPIFWLLTKIQSVVINWGASIIILTVIIKSRLLPVVGQELQVHGQYAQGTAKNG